MQSCNFPGCCTTGLRAEHPGIQAYLCVYSTQHSSSLASLGTLKDHSVQPSGAARFCQDDRLPLPLATGSLLSSAACWSHYQGPSPRPIRLPVFGVPSLYSPWKSKHITLCSLFGCPGRDQCLLCSLSLHPLVSYQEVSEGFTVQTPCYGCV